MFTRPRDLFRFAGLPHSFCQLQHKSLLTICVSGTELPGHRLFEFFGRAPVKSISFQCNPHLGKTHASWTLTQVPVWQCQMVALWRPGGKCRLEFGSKKSAVETSAAHVPYKMPFRVRFHASSQARKQALASSRLLG